MEEVEKILKKVLKIRREYKNKLSKHSTHPLVGNSKELAEKGIEKINRVVEACEKFLRESI